jgi:hypothetical protein
MDYSTCNTTKDLNEREYGGARLQEEEKKKKKPFQ